VKKLILN